MQWDDDDWEWGDGGWNNKWRPTGSGTTSHARRARIQAAAQERDRLAALGDSAALADKAKKEAQKAASMKKQAEEAAEQAARTAAQAAEAAAAASQAAGWVEVGPSRKKPRKGPPCQKEKPNKREPPCQKEQPKKKETPCQKEQQKKKETPCPKEQPKKKETPCQKGQANKKETPCQKEQEKKDAPGQKEQKESVPPEGSKDGVSKKLGPSEKEQAKEKEQSKGLTKAKDDSLPKGKKSSHQSSDDGMSVDWGNSSSSASASSGTPSPGSPDPLTKGDDGKKGLPKKQPPKRVAVDWHKVLVHNNLYDLTATPWLQKLKDAGYEVHLLSYCGWKRSHEVYDWAWFEWNGWASVSFTWKQCGKEGKAQWCLDNGVSKLVDDNADICSEAIQFGIQAYPIVPAGQRREKGQPKLQSCFSDFAAAAIDILKEENP